MTGEPTMDLPNHTEYTATQGTAAVFDLSARGLVELTGPEAVPFLHNLCTNDIKNLAAGRGCEFFLTTNKARVVGHGFAHRLLPAESPVLWLDVDPGSGAKVAAHLNHFIVSEQVEIADKGGTVALFHVAGPRAGAAVEQVLGVPPPMLDELQHALVGGVRLVWHRRL